jgi:hypothetical protein
MALVPDEGAVQELAAASPRIQRSAIAFMRGARTLQSTVRMPASARTASNTDVKFGPRSRIMNLTRCVWSPRSIRRLRACCLATWRLGDLALLGAGARVLLGAVRRGQQRGSDTGGDATSACG